VFYFISLGSLQVYNSNKVLRDDKEQKDIEKYLSVKYNLPGKFAKIDPNRKIWIIFSN
jgi:hypothetical protein